MASDADHAYDHCLAVLRHPPLATTATAAALARAGRNRAAVLAQARQQALNLAGEAPPDAAGAAPAPVEPIDAAWALAATRPPEERAVVDLELRHGLDRQGLGRALGLPPSRAAAVAADVRRRWDDDLRPALLARLGPGGCADLAEVLAGAGLGVATLADEDEGGPPLWGPADMTVADLVAAAPAVAAHVEGCAACADRVRAMASVHTLLAQVPTAGAPPEARAIRPATRRPVPRPRVRPPRRALATGIAVVVVAGAVLATVLLVRRSPSPRVDALTRVPAHNALAASPDVVHPGQAFVVSNKGSRARRWHASATEPWLRIAPADGRLGARGAVQVEVDVTSSAPEGDVQADVTVTADDGSTALVHVEGSVEHPPTVAADAEGCQVRATAEDEGEVASVELHWTGSNGPGFAAMAPLADGYAAQVPAEDLPATWWVVAVDGRGNRAQTSERELTAC